MKKFLFLALAGAAALGCAQDTTAPATSSATTASDAAVLTTFGADVWLAGAGWDGPGGFGRAGHALRELPDNIALTTGQQTSIQTLVTAFHSANASDIATLDILRRAAHAAHESGQSADSLAAIAAHANPIRARLDTAESALTAQIGALLTPAQHAWLAAHERPRCDLAVALSDEQKSQIHVLIDAFKAENQADLILVQREFDARRANRGAGMSSPSAEVTAALGRLRTARTVLESSIHALLTPGQQASECFLGVPGPGRHRGPGGGGMHP